MAKKKKRKAIRKAIRKTPRWICQGCGKKAKGISLGGFKHKPGCPYFGHRILIGSAKAKGRAFQQAVRDLFISYGDNGKVASEDIVSRTMGEAGADVIFYSVAARELFPFFVECKAIKHGTNVTKEYEYTDQRADVGQIPLLFHRKDRGQSLVTMSLGTFEKFLGLWVEDDVERSEIVRGGGPCK